MEIEVQEDVSVLLKIIWGSRNSAPICWFILWIPVMAGGGWRWEQEAQVQVSYRVEAPSHWSQPLLLSGFAGICCAELEADACARFSHMACGHFTCIPKEEWRHSVVPGFTPKLDPHCEVQSDWYGDSVSVWNLASGDLNYLHLDFQHFF